MDIRPTISIIVPCYNDGKFIQECLDSIHNQDYEYYEIVVINDGSSDSNTNKIISKINHPKIKVIQTPNQGPAKARNQAIQSSTGKYILPLDADNKIAKPFIKEAIEILEKRPEIKIVSSDLEIFGLYKGKLKFDEFSIELLLCKNLMECASIYRRSDYDKTIGYNPNMKATFEDWDFWLSLLETGGEVYQIRKYYVSYRIKKTSRNQTVNFEQHKRLRRQLYNNHKEFFSKYFLDPMECYEYQTIYNSKEYKIGRVLLSPLRKIHRFFKNLIN